MALITCGECGKKISDKAAACVNCGAPVEKKNEEKFTFCGYCGKKLAEGQECQDCKQVENKRKKGRKKKEDSSEESSVVMGFCGMCGKQTADGSICKSCQGIPEEPKEEINTNSFCGYCGKELPVGEECSCQTATLEVQPIEGKFCPSCGTLMREGANFCKTCGYQTGVTVPVISQSNYAVPVVDSAPKTGMGIFGYLLLLISCFLPYAVLNFGLFGTLSLDVINLFKSNIEEAMVFAVFYVIIGIISLFGFLFALGRIKNSFLVALPAALLTIALGIFTVGLVFVKEADSFNIANSGVGYYVGLLGLALVIINMFSSGRILWRFVWYIGIIIFIVGFGVTLFFGNYMVSTDSSSQYKGEIENIILQ